MPFTGAKRKLLDKLHIASPGRKEMRKQVADLKARTLLLLPDPKAQELKAKLAEADAALSTAAGGNEGRAKTVATAEAICKAVEPELVKLEKAKPKAQVLEFPKAKTVREDKSSVEAVKARLKELQKKLKDAEPELMSAMLKDGLTHVELTGKVQMVELSMPDAPIDAVRGKELLDRLTAIEGLINVARGDVDRVKKKAAQIRDVTIPAWDNGPVSALRTALGPKARQTPALMAVESLRQAVTAGRLIYIEDIERLEQSATDELAKIANDPNYAQGAAVQIDMKARGADHQRKFDEKLAKKLEALRVTAEAFGDDSHLSTQKTAADARIELGKGTSDDTTADNAIAAAELTVDEALRAAETRFQDLRKAVLEQKEKMAAQLKGQADSRYSKLLELDWKQLDGMWASVEELTAGAAGKLEDAVPNLRTAQGALTAIETRFKKFLADLPEVQMFEPTRKRLKADLEDSEVAGDGGFLQIAKAWSLLAVWFPDTRKEVDEGIDKLDKELPKLTGKAAVDKLAKLRKTLDDKSTEVEELRKLCVEAGKELGPAKLLYKQALADAKAAGSPIKEPNDHSLALDTLSNLLKTSNLVKAPPNKTVIDAAVAKLKEAFDGLDAASVRLAADASSSAVAREQATEEHESKALKDARWARLRTIKADLDAAEQAVSKVKGDKNAVKAAKRLAGEVKAAIKAADDADAASRVAKVGAANRALDRLQQRVELIMSNPAGEANRKATELPKLYAEWQATLERAGSALDLMISEIDGWKGTQPNTVKTEADKFRDRLAAYRQNFTNEKQKLYQAIGILRNTEEPDASRRKAREIALQQITDHESGLLAHPLTKALTKAPFESSNVGPRLIRGLGKLRYAVLTSVQAETE